MTETVFENKAWSGQVRDVRFGGVKCRAVDTPWGVAVKLPGGLPYHATGEFYDHSAIAHALSFSCSRHVRRHQIVAQGQVIFFPFTAVVHHCEQWHLYDAKLVESPVHHPPLEPWELQFIVECPLCRAERERWMGEAFRKMELEEQSRGR